jgi:hypothetical protein
LAGAVAGSPSVTCTVAGLLRQFPVSFAQAGSASPPAPAVRHRHGRRWKTFVRRIPVDQGANCSAKDGQVWHRTAAPTTSADAIARFRTTNGGSGCRHQWKYTESYPATPLVSDARLIVSDLPPLLDRRFSDRAPAGSPTTPLRPFDQLMQRLLGTKWNYTQAQCTPRSLLHVSQPTKHCRHI